MLKHLVPAALLATFAASASVAQAVSADDPFSVMRAVQAYGHEASIGTDSYGDPKVDATVEGINYTILFYRCDNNTDCEDLQFRASYEAPNVGTSTMNAWNLDEAIGKAYVNENDSAIVEHYVIDVRDMSTETFDNVLESFVNAMDKFQEHIDW